MTIDELASKYNKEASKYNVDVTLHYLRSCEDLNEVVIRIRGRDEYYVHMFKSKDNKLVLQLVRVFGEKSERVINEEEYRPLSDEEPYPSLKYVREFITRSIEKASWKDLFIEGDIK